MNVSLQRNVVLSWARLSVQLRLAVFRVALTTAIYRETSSIDSLILKQWTRTGKGNISRGADEKFRLRRRAAPRFNSKIIDAWKFINFIRLTPLRPVNSAVDEKFRAFTFSHGKTVFDFTHGNCIKIDVPSRRSSSAILRHKSSLHCTRLCGNFSRRSANMR